MAQWGAGSPAIGILACAGGLPFAVADSLIARGAEPVIFGLEGVCDPARLASYRHHSVQLGKFGRLVRLLHAANCRQVILLGSLVRPSLKDMRFDWGALRMIPKIAVALRGGDDHLLTRIAHLIEGEGFRVVGVAEAAPELLMPEGPLTQVIADDDAVADIAHGREALRALGPFDVGQSVVVVDRHIVGVEGIEGTDALLARIAQLRSDGRLRKKAGRGVLVKGPKLGQDPRLDLPTIGPVTVQGVAHAGLAGIAIVAGQTVLADAQAMTAAADRAGLFIVGERP